MAALALAVAPAAAQSSHLARLEATVPAVAPDPVSVVALGGWMSAWLAPAAGGEVTGVLAGLEHSGFAALTTTLAAARVRLGPLWQVSVAQTRVTDLFDRTLLATYPELRTLGASATQVGLDGAVSLGAGVRVSLGGRYERDEFLDDATSDWAMRLSATAPLVLGVRSAVAFEKVVAAGARGVGTGRLRLGIARAVGTQRLGATLAAGATAGDVWSLGSGHRAVATSVRLTLLEIVAVSAALGAERDPFGGGGWLGFWSVGLGLAVGPIGADLRRGGVGATQAAPTAVSLRYEP